MNRIRIMNILTIFIILVVIFFLGYTSSFILYKNQKNEIKKEIYSEISKIDSLDILTSWANLEGNGKNNPLSESYSTKGEVLKEYPFIGDYLVDNSEVDWKNLENDWVVIQNEIIEAGINGRIEVPKPKVGYRINRPLILRQGQTLTFAPNTKVYDDTGDFAFKIIGEKGFPNNALTHIILRNLDIEGSPRSKGAIKIDNAYLINLDNIKISGYENNSSRAISLSDFFQINLNTVQVNNIKNGIGILVDSVNGNSGQLNLMNTIIQRCRVGLQIEGSNNLIDGVNMYGGAIGNNYSVGMVIGKNVNNVNIIGSHFENHDGKKYSGKTAVSMELEKDYTSESINFYGNLFVNNQYSIKSNNIKRATISGNQFDGRQIEGAIAIHQGKGDNSWLINPNQFLNNTEDLVESGSNHINLSSISIDESGVIYPQNSKSGIYSGAGDPNGKIEGNSGSIYLRTDDNSNYHFYIKKRDNTSLGWQPLILNE
ncbi:hypothetical protein [Niallia circulans]|nr:hypothetical protein [Niallia circulans]MCB5237679.1 hypothetical protein [Niallia circulans]